MARCAAGCERPLGATSRGIYSLPETAFAAKALSCRVLFARFRAAWTAQVAPTGPAPESHHAPTHLLEATSLPAPGSGISSVPRRWVRARALYWPLAATAVWCSCGA